MRYNFKCENIECEHIEPFIFPMEEIQDIQTESNGKEKPKCPVCQTKMKRIYEMPKIRKYKGLITPKQVQTPDGKVHKLSSNLMRL